jgi:hypothetical protein
MKTLSILPLSGGVVVTSALLLLTAAQADEPGWKVLGWNNLGMHCMDSDYRVFSILPPYNTIDAHVIGPDGRKKGPSDGVSMFYEAVADPDGSITTSSVGRSTFWQYSAVLYGPVLPPDQGLEGNPMPGPQNIARPLHWGSGPQWWEAAGIPITPINDQGRRQPYPMLRLTARNSTGGVLAHADVVVPVSSEMDCRSCHGSDTVVAAKPAAGWESNPDPELDFRLNILKLHDEKQAGKPNYAGLLALAGYSAQGLHDSAAHQNTPVLCAKCHASEALPGSGQAGVPPLTTAIHSRHAGVISPLNGLSLDNSANRSACYTCHPGSDTRCLRGAMGAAVAADGSLAMQCQSCHGTMSQVGSATRTGWLEEPNCQQCHTGTATQNSGAIRFTSVFDTNGNPRVAANTTFATNPDTPLPGLSLYRFSHGHGGLACSACHGSTHAIYPTSHRNDNLMALDHQGHSGTIAECRSCHATMPSTRNGGPHGMHPTDAAWAGDGHKEALEALGVSSCRACHGIDERGTVLSRTFADRTFVTSQYGTKFWSKGHSVSCYDCHKGSASNDRNSNRAPVVAARSLQVPRDTATAITLAGTDADNNTLTLRIARQPLYGTVGLANKVATYIPAPGYVGPDHFTYLAFDGQTEGLPAVVSVTVGTPPANLDSDGDGLTDLLEYALGLDPFAPSLTTTDFVTGADAKTRFTLTVGSAFRPPDTTLAAESSGDLIHWSANPADVLLEFTPHGIKATDQHPIDSDPRHFLRLKASRP